MSDSSAGRASMLIPPDGPARALSPAEAREEWGGDAASPGLLWRRLRVGEPGEPEWLEQRAGVPEVVAEGLLAPQTQPRLWVGETGLLVVLRGVNLNPDAAPEDMVSVRLWVEPARVLSVTLRDLKTTASLRAGLERGEGPRTAGALLAAIAEGLVERAGPVVAALTERTDDLELGVIDPDLVGDLAALAALRRRAMILRRYLTPQRDTIRRLATLQHAVLDDAVRAGLSDTASEAERIVADLELIRERASVLADEQQGALASQANNTVFYLTVIAGVFLPLSLITGLLGINTGGVPLADSAAGFWIVTILLALLAVAEVVVLVRLRWISLPRTRG